MRHAATALALLLLLSSPALAIPSLDTKDILEVDAKTKVGAAMVDVRFTVLRDADSFTDFYYLPSRPFIATKDGAPVFAIVKYQDQSKEDKEKLVEGGILQFAVTLAMPDDARAEVKKQLAKKFTARVSSVEREIDATESAWQARRKKDPKFEPNRLEKQSLEAKREWVAKASGVTAESVELKMLPLAGSQVNLYAPTGAGGDGKMVDSQLGPAIAPANAGALMPFSLSLGRLGVNVYKTLVEGSTGIPMVIQYKYFGLTPPAGFQVIVDWDQTFKHYSKSEAVRVGGGFGPFKAGVSVDRDKIREELVNNKCIEVRILTDPETFSMKDVTRILEPLLARIQNELCEAMAPPQVEPARAATDTGQNRPAPGNELVPTIPVNFGFGSHQGFAMKDIQKVKKGKEVFNFEVRQALERTTMAGGFVGIGEWPKEVRDACVTVVPRGGWESAYLVLPTVADRVADTGVVAIDLTAVVVAPDGKESQRQTARWEAATKAWTFGGRKRTSLAFALMELYTAHGEEAMKGKAKYRLETQFTFEKDSFVSTQEIPMFTGDFPAASPLNTIRPVNLSFEGLTFAMQSPDSTLQSVKVTLRSGKRIFESKTLKPLDAMTAPDDLVWYVDGNLPVTANVVFDYRDIGTGKMRRTHHWKYNMLALNQPRVVEKPALPAREKVEQQFGKIAEKKLEGAARRDAWAAIVRNGTGAQTIANAEEKATESLQPLGLSITLGDARLRDTWASRPKGAVSSEDDDAALGEYLEALEEKGLELSPGRINRVAGRPLWFLWDPSIDE